MLCTLQLKLCLKYVLTVGGETIRDINRLSGAFVELSRTNNPSSPQRVFNIKGSPDQVQEAVRLICEKAGLVSFSLCKIQFFQDF